MKSSAVISSVVLFVAFVVSTPSMVIAETAGEVVESTTTILIERLNSERVQLNMYPERIYGLVNELVIPHFDFRNMSRLVLGNAWKNATEDQQSAFLEQFKTLLVRTYATALREYSDNKIIYHPEETKPNSRLVVVKTEVQDAINNSSIPIDYRMYDSDGSWMVVDVAVDGISLVSTYRGSFASEIRKNGLDSLITKLVERNDDSGGTQ